MTPPACGVNFPDTLMVQDLYQFKPPLPFTPGGEVSGVVAGSRRRGGNPPSRSVTGWAAACGVGGFAEKVAVAGVVGVPGTRHSIDYPVAGIVPHDLRHVVPRASGDRAKLQPGESLLVLGAAGGVGLAAGRARGGPGAR